MKVRCVAAFADLNKSSLVGKTAIMIDALRASATIIAAVSNGCDRIVPAEEAGEAAAIKRISEGNLLLCGERGGTIVAGFDLGNSPLEYTQSIVEDKVLLYSTSSGSIAIKGLAEAEDVLIATFINATAAAQKAYSLERDIVLVCAGTDDAFSVDDILAMGCIINRLKQLDPNIETDDLGKVALKMYEDARMDLNAALEGSRQYEFLKELGMFDDLEYCTREDMFNVVPIYKEGVIVKAD